MRGTCCEGGYLGEGGRRRGKFLQFLANVGGANFCDVRSTLNSMKNYTRSTLRNAKIMRNVMLRSDL